MHSIFDSDADRMIYAALRIRLPRVLRDKMQGAIHSLQHDGKVYIRFVDSNGQQGVYLPYHRDFPSDADIAHLCVVVR